MIVAFYRPSVETYFGEEDSMQNSPSFVHRDGRSFRQGSPSEPYRVPLK
jgi:hypothetical protein